MALQIRYGTDTEFESGKSNILSGEMGITTDTERSVVGVDDGEYMELLNIESLAPAYDSSETYTTGDVCSYGGKLYVLMGGSATGSWDSSLWEETTLGEVMEKLKLGKNTTTESGDIVSFTNPYNRTLPFVSVKADITAQQSGSGDPSPDNVRPITGFTGANVYVRDVNLWDEEWVNGFFNDSGVFTSRNDIVGAKNAIPVKPNTTYYFVHSEAVFITYWKSAVTTSNAPSSEFISRQQLSNLVKTFTTPSDCRYIFFNCATQYGTTYNNDISINYPSTDHDYHAYSGEDYATSFGSTVYGGTLNVTTGVLTVTHAEVDLGDLTWNKVTSGQAIYFSSSAKLNPLAKYATNNRNIICSQYTFGSIGSTGTAQGFYVIDTSYVRIRDANLESLDTTAFKTAMDGVQLVYELATPTEVQLTPTEVKTLLGQNNVWADTGEVEVTYYTRG